jgi:hypothetical protein
VSGEPPPVEGPKEAIKWLGFMFVPAAVQSSKTILDRVINKLTGVGISPWTPSVDYCSFEQ